MHTNIGNQPNNLQMFGQPRETKKGKQRNKRTRSTTPQTAQAKKFTQTADNKRYSPAADPFLLLSSFFFRFISHIAQVVNGKFVWITRYVKKLLTYF